MIFRRVDLLVTGDKIVLGPPGNRRGFTIASTKNSGRQLLHTVYIVSFVGDDCPPQTWYDCDMIELM